MKKAKEKKTPQKRAFGIKILLGIGFLIPIAFVILVGSLTYLKAEKAMINNYEKTTLNCMDMGMRYLDVGFSQVKTDALEFTMNNDLRQYIVGYYDASNKVMEKSQLQKSVRDNMIAKGSNKFIQSTYFVTSKSQPIITSEKTGAPGVCDTWITTDEGKKVKEAAQKNKFIGSHPKLDGLLGISGDQYAFSYMDFFAGDSAFLMINLSKKPIQEGLTNLELGKGSFASYITKDGREIKSDEKSELTFMDQKFCKDSFSSDKMSGTAYIDYKGQEFLYLYSKSKDTGAMICSFVPKTVVTQEVTEIKNITVVLILAACAVAALLSVGIGFKITSGIGRISKKIAIASKGDLTVDIKSKGNDEFGVLGRDIMEMIGNTRTLIGKVNDMILEVTDASNEVKGVSERLILSTGDITESIHTIDSGISNQADSSKECVTKMGVLSDEMQLIRQDVSEMQQLIDTSSEMVSQGIVTMNELSEQSQITTEKTGSVKKSVEELEVKTSSIGEFVSVINDIAAQTNLLSLNASIEAARAGEAGRGFAVVAEEIRNLADGSRQAAEEIRGIVDYITAQTREVVKEAAGSETVVEKQAIIVDRTITIFDEINKQTEQLLNELEQIQKNVDSSEEQRSETLTAIESISAISTRTAVSSGKVDKTAEGQMAVAEELQEASENLNDKMLELQEIIQKFKI
jgi:methyl-accepting chemotaxis protein